MQHTTVVRMSRPTHIAFVLVLLLIPIREASSQSAQARNARFQTNQQMSFYMEFLGNAFLYSANLDYRFHPAMSARVGAGLVGLPFSDESELMLFPITLNALPGWGAKRVELGAGVVLGEVGTSDGNRKFHLTMTLGYRYQSPESGKVFRIGITPSFFWGAWLFPWIGISVGGVLHSW